MAVGAGKRQIENQRRDESETDVWWGMKQRFSGAEDGGKVLAKGRNQVDKKTPGKALHPPTHLS